MNDNEESEEFNKFMNKINDKLKSNPELNDEVKLMVDRLEEIFGTEIDISLIYDKNISDYSAEFEEYDLDNEISVEEKMKVHHLIDMLNDEEKDYTISIDPIYLKDGINDIENILITTYKDKLIIVPLIENK